MTIRRPLISRLGVLFAVLISCGALAENGQRRLFQPEDIHRIKDVGNIEVSPDGEWVAYSVSTTNIEKDEDVSDLFMVNWDGSTRIQLTHTESTEYVSIRPS